MERYISYVVSKPKTVLALLVLITLVLGSGIPKLRFDTSVDVMMPQGDDQYLFNEEVKKIYGNNGKVIVMHLAASDYWNRAFFSEVEKLTADIEEFKDFNEERETARLERFRAVIKEGHPDREKLLGAFSDDGVFQRTLARLLDELPLNGSVLNRLALVQVGNRLERIIGIKKQELVSRVITPINMKDMSGKNDTLCVVNLVEKDDNDNCILPSEPVDFELYKKRLSNNPAFDGAFFSRDKKTGAIDGFAVIIRLENIKKDDEISRELWNIAKSYTAIDITPMGIPIVNIFMSDYMKRDLLSFLPLVLLVVLMVFFINFRTLRGMALPMATLIITDTWIMGLMGHLGVNITVVGTSLPTLMVSVGSSYSIHILNQYYIDLGSIIGMDKRKGLTIAMRHIAVTVLLAGFTTFIGFFSLVTSQVTGIRDWGLFSAIGVFFAVVISTSMIPAMLSILSQKKPRLMFGKSPENEGDDHETWIDPFLRTVTGWSIRHSRKVMIVLGFFIAFSCIGAGLMKVDTNFMAYFKEHDYIRTSATLIGDKYGGTTGFTILIDSGEQDGVKEPKFLNTVDEFRHWLVLPENRELNISRTDAFSDVIKTMHMAMNNDDPTYWRIPEKKMDIMDYMEIYSGDDDDFDGRYDDFESYIDVQYRTVMVFAKIHHHDGKLISTRDTEIIQQKIDDHLKKTLPPPYTYRITGEPSIMVRLADYQVSGQMSSLALSLFVVCLVVIGLFKSWKAGLVSLIPMGTAVIMNFGVMGWFGISLDTATSIIAAVTIGIGVDDTIHFLNSYRHFRSRGMSVDETIQKTLAISGKAIIYTSLALIFGFSVLVVSNFIPLIYTGFLIANTMVATTIGALILLPAAIKAFNISLDPSPSDSLFWRIFYIGRFFDFSD